MATRQPKWEMIANLGDVSPLDYGGYFVYRDTTGVYPAEAELLVVDDEGDEDSTYTAYRVVLDRLKLVDGYLVPLAYDPSWSHPLERYDEWFHKELEAVASSIGSTKESLEALFTSDELAARALAYRAVGEYHGWDNFDDSPMTGMTRAEAKKRYGTDLKQLQRQA